jgi:hypothetical protein
MYPTAAFVNYVHTTKLHNNVGGNVYHLLWFLQLRLTNQPTITVAALMVKHPLFTYYVSFPQKSDILSLHKMNWLALAMETECIYCVVQMNLQIKLRSISIFKGLDEKWPHSYVEQSKLALKHIKI